MRRRVFGIVFTFLVFSGAATFLLLDRFGVQSPASFSHILTSSALVILFISRLRKVGLSIYMSVFALVPGLNFIFGLYLFAREETSDAYDERVV